ncbi:MAG TPA: Holliday junction resolvase RuvX, partial [Candidatus Saccharimonadales bacterium]|nr:Holliday junction resolvase RuvX [Candidatus Saccharimonadales bacterium]
MRHNAPEEFLGVDVGSARVGVARGSSSARLAEPLKTVDAKMAVPELKTLAAGHQAAGIVVGLPRNLDGQDTAQTQFVRDWVGEAKVQ